MNGFFLRANTEIPAHRRDQLERLMRYTARGAVSLEWLAEDANGDLIYAFHRPWSDGTTITLSPLELLDKLSAFVPLPTCSCPLCGVSGATQHVSRCDHPHTALVWTARKTWNTYWHWARLLGCVFDLALATSPCRRIHSGSLPPSPRVGDQAHLASSRVLASPPPIALARCRQEIFAFD